KSLTVAAIARNRPLQNRSFGARPQFHLVPLPSPDFWVRLCGLANDPLRIWGWRRPTGIATRQKISRGRNVLTDCGHAAVTVYLSQFCPSDSDSHGFRSRRISQGCPDNGRGVCFRENPAVVQFVACRILFDQWQGFSAVRLSRENRFRP